MIDEKITILCGIENMIAIRNKGVITALASKNNARLIAAAPELLLALIDAEKRLRGAGMLGGNDDPVRAAIAKAEGN